MATKFLLWVSQVGSLFNKDFKAEFRTKYALNSFLMFAVTTLVMISFAAGPYRLDTIMHAVFLWLTLFFSAMAGLARVFIKEEERGTAYALKLSAVPEIIFLGKFLFNFVLLLLVMIVIVPLYIFFLSPPLGSPGLLTVILVLGGLGLTGTTTILAAVVSRANVKGSLMSVLAFPVLLPLLITVINATRLALEGCSFAECSAELRVLLSFFFIIITVSLMLFNYVWED